MNATNIPDRKTLITELKSACNNDTLLTPKHDINGFLVLEKYRSVLTHEASSSLKELINSEQYELEAYYNKTHKKYSYHLIPYDTGSYSVLGLGILSGSLETSGSFDSYLVVSGSSKGSEGWHIYSENLIKIQEQEFICKL